MKISYQARDRFIRTTRRLLSEVCWLRTEQTALRTLVGKEHIGLDFFLVAHTALMGDRLIRLVRVFEDSKKVASFWYLYRCKPGKIEELLKAARVKVDDLRDFSQRLKIIRDKSFVHIDRDEVFDPKAIYKKAGIKGKQIQRAIEGIWRVLNQLYRETEGLDFPHDEYSGDDILHLLELRDKESESSGKGPFALRPTS